MYVSLYTYMLHCVHVRIVHMSCTQVRTVNSIFMYVSCMYMYMYRHVFHACGRPDELVGPRRVILETSINNQRLYLLISALILPCNLTTI